MAQEQNQAATIRSLQDKIAELQNQLMLVSLLAISPVDGRYTRYTKGLTTVASEYGLIRYRVTVMVMYLIALMNGGIAPSVVNAEKTLRDILDEFSPNDAYAIKQIETKGWRHIKKPLTHDVKACEVWLRWKLEELGLGAIIERIHFGKTSEDVNNIAYGLMLRDSVNLVMADLEQVHILIRSFADRYATLPMLSRTHGQPATPTTLGKEFAVFAARLDREMQELVAFPLLLKLNGASGNYAAMVAANPDTDWVALSKEFIESDIYIKSSDHVAFVHNPLTTQIEPHDTYARLFQVFVRINTILIDFSQDLWRYVSDDWIVQVAVQGEVGSSAMPHKVNPIQAENCEGNLGIANALLNFCSGKLPISRLQRDLSDSTVERVFGTMFGHMMISYQNISAFMEKISANETAIGDALNAHPEVLTEAIQTILRSVNYPNAYDVLKSLSRGAKLTMDDIHSFIDGLDSTFVSDNLKDRMKSLTPREYIGLAESLARSVH